MLFNVTADNKLKANEVSDMLYSFPTDDPCYAECMKLADTLLNLHFGKQTKKINTTSFQYFKMLIKKSVLVKWVIRCLSEKTDVHKMIRNMQAEKRRHKPHKVI
jgi:hypothetical protein